VPFTLVVALISGMERVTGCRCSEEYREDRNGALRSSKTKRGRKSGNNFV